MQIYQYLGICIRTPTLGKYEFVTIMSTGSQFNFSNEANV